MSRLITWKRLDTPGVEHARIRLDPLQIEGQVIYCEDGVSTRITYEVAYDQMLMASAASIRLTRGGKVYHRSLTRDGIGSWKVDGVELQELKGIADVDLSITPSTNTPPIRRLKLAPGTAMEVMAVWVRFPNLDVLPLRQTYRNISPNCYEYEAPDLSFRTTVHCDNDGVVKTFSGVWEIQP